MLTTRMSGKRALVTGAASGIGKAVVSCFVKEGAWVIGADIAYADAGSPASETALELHLDVSDPNDWEQVMAQAGQLDAVVACAGISEVRSIAETSIDDWRRVMAVNLDGVFLSVKYAARAMRESQGGTIVVVGSASGVKAAPGASAYCASKAAVRMLGKAAALELKAEGIRVNCVSPAGVVTPMWRGMPFWNDLVRQHGSEEAAWNALGGADPGKASIQRMAFPEEIAEAIVFLSCEQSAHITGADLAVDGGYTA
jgi:NAD(P)-dependent dehydrogenase (short-subunit alcohol dehydrogenase family)